MKKEIFLFFLFALMIGSYSADNGPPSIEETVFCEYNETGDGFGVFTLPHFQAPSVRVSHETDIVTTYAVKKEGYNLFTIFSTSTEYSDAEDEELLTWNHETAVLNEPYEHIKEVRPIGPFTRPWACTILQPPNTT